MTETETVLVAGGQDWDQIVDAARNADPGERIVVNMGPQHPSTHGVLRLILEIEGETVTEVRCGIGYLHTGIEKNLEYRYWTQGVTFVTRMDYLAPFFNEAAYCLGVEKLLGITDEIPERVNVIRVMMMELNRISSHLVALATGGLELGAMTPMFTGFRGREIVLNLFEAITGLRMNHAYIRPGGVAQDLPPNGEKLVADAIKELRHPLREMGELLNENAIWKARTQGVGYLDLTGCMALGITGPILRSTGLPYDLSKSEPYCGYENYEFDVITDDGCDAYGRYIIRVKEMWESMKIVEQCLDKLRAGPDHDRGPQDRLAGRPEGGPGRHGQLTRAHRQDHGRLDGGADPPLQAGHRGHPGSGRPGLRGRRIAPRGARRAHGQRRRHPALPGALPGPVIHQPAGRRRDVRGRDGRGPHRRGRQHRPGDGRGRPMTGPQGQPVFIRLGPPPEEPNAFVVEGAPQSYSPEVRARLEVDAKEIIGRYPNKRSALVPLLHLVQSEDSYLTPAGLEFCGEQLGLTGAEVSAVASFYTMYRRGPTGDYLVGVCTNTLCAVMGGDAIFETLEDHLGIGNDADHPRRQDHAATRRVQRRLRLRTGGDGQLGILRQPDAGVGAGTGGLTALRQASGAHPRGSTVRLSRDVAHPGRRTRRAPRPRPGRRGRSDFGRSAGGEGTRHGAAATPDASGKER